MLNIISFLFAAMVLLLFKIHAQTVLDFTGSIATKAETRNVFGIHNKVLADVKVQGLEWSVEVAKYAQE